MSVAHIPTGEHGHELLGTLRMSRAINNWPHLSPEAVELSRVGPEPNPAAPALPPICWEVSEAHPPLPSPPVAARWESYPQGHELWRAGPGGGHR